MTEAEQSTIREHCRQLLAEYALAVDGADAAAMTALFTEDGLLVRGSAELRGCDELPRILDGRAEGTLMRHLVATQSISVSEDGKSARAHSYYLLYSGVGSAPPLPMPAPFSMGDWHSDLVRTPGGWRIARQEIRRMFMRDGQR